MISEKNINAEEMNSIIDRANLVTLARTNGGKVASSKVFSVCPDCRDIVNVDGCACQCSRHDNGRWYKRTGGWQYIPGTTMGASQ